MGKLKSKLYDLALKPVEHIYDQNDRLIFSDDEKSIQIKSSVEQHIKNVTTFLTDKIEIGKETTIEELQTIIDEANKQFNKKNVKEVGNLITAMAANIAYEQNIQGYNIVNEQINDFARKEIAPFNESYKEWLWNPFYEGMFFSEQMVNSSVMRYFMPNPAALKDKTEYFKRVHHMTKQGNEFVIVPEYGIAPEINVMDIADLKESSVEVNGNINEMLKDTGIISEEQFINGHLNVVNSTDGAIILDPITDLNYMKSLGNNIGYTKPGAKKYTSTEDKGAYFTINEDMMNKSTRAEKILQFMWGQEIYDLYKKMENDGIPYNERIERLADWVSYNNKHGEIIGQLRFKGARKMLHNKQYSYDITNEDHIEELLQRREEILANINR